MILYLFLFLFTDSEQGVPSSSGSGFESSRLMSPSEMSASLHSENGHSDQSDGEDISMQDHDLNSDDDNLSENLDQSEDTLMDASYSVNSPEGENDSDLANGNAQNVQVS